jgi:hypothetical protein
MIQPAFDTLRFAERLEKVGVPREQASEFSKTLGDFMQERLATKEDLEKLATKEDLQSLKGEFQALKGEFQAFKIDLIKWMALFFGLSVSILSFVIAAFKFFH